MRRYDLLKITTLVAALLVLWGCEPSDPGSPFGNTPPETFIVVAPLDSTIHDHFVSPSPMSHIQWYGHDADGLVDGFYLQVDDGAEVWTVSGDSAISFESSEPDPGNPGFTIPMDHTIRVTAVDNEGARDPSPAARSFTAKNSIPRITAFTSSFRDSAVVGQGISFSVEWEDGNVSDAVFRVSVDTEPVTGWDSRSSFQFCDLQDPTIIAGLDQGEVLAIDMLYLPVGSHLISVHVKDLGGAVSNPRNRFVTVIDTVAPGMTTLNATYGSATYYPDGSIFHVPRTTTYFEMVGSASSYFGGIHSYKYRMRSQSIPETPADSSWSSWSAWSQWGTSAFQMSDLPVGEYHFQAQCRDWVGKESAVIDKITVIVEPDFSAKTLLIVDETKDGNGRAGSPDDENCDTFYRHILEVDTNTWMTSSGWEVTELDHNSHKVYPTVSGVSARDLAGKRLIIWHADDKSVIDLGKDIRVLGEYLDRGGKLILSGWDVLSPFAVGNTDVTFTTGFAYKYLRIGRGVKNIEVSSAGGFIAMQGNPDLGYDYLVEMDPDKISARWLAMDNCWIFYPRHRTEGLGFWRGYLSDTEFENGFVCLRNFNPVNAWRTVVLGYPLYFMKNDQAKAFITRVLEEIDS